MYHVIIQARMGSKRLPGKSLKKYNNITPLEVLVKRIKKVKKISKIIIATTKLKTDNIIFKHSKKLNVEIYRGSNLNVLNRYYHAAKKFDSKNIIRLTADCPFIDLNTLKKMIKIFSKTNCNYLSNTYPLPCTYPDGSDIEIFDFKSLEQSSKKAFLPSDKEHVTKYLWNSKKFKCKRIDNKKNLSNYRYTIDTIDDFKLFSFIIKKNLGNYLNLTMNKIIKLIDKNPSLVKYQKKIKRNFGWVDSLKKDKSYKKRKKC